MPLHKDHSFGTTFIAPVMAPEFPPPLFRQPPSPGAIRNALSSPPFVWNGVSLRVFREPTSLSEFAKLEERGQFLSQEHKHWYKILKSALAKDLEDLKKRHEIENGMEPSLRAAIEEREKEEFHKEFMRKLQWGEDSSPLLLRPANYSDNGLGQPGESNANVNTLPHEEFHEAMVKFVSRGLETKIPSIKMYFENYPGPTVAWAVQDFYKRQELAREAAKLGLEFQQMWEWGERHWNFFEGAARLRAWVRKGIAKAQWCSADILHEYDTTVKNWTPIMESRKRRHQWAVLKRIMRAYELRNEKFPEIWAPAGRSFEQYFGKYGKKEGWYPVDIELESSNSTDNVIMEQIDGIEKALEAGESLVEACAAAVDGCSESVIRHLRLRNASPPRTVEEADALLVQMRSGTGAVLSRLRSGADAAVVEPNLEGLPDPADDSNGDAKVDTQSWLTSLRKKLIGDVCGALCFQTKCLNGANVSLAGSRKP